MSPTQYAAKHGLTYRTVCKLIAAGKLAAVPTVKGLRVEYEIAPDAVHTRGKPGRKANSDASKTPA